MYPSVKAFAKENPTMILTLCYVLITVIGTGYSFFFYREFDINIIKFADLSDFLLAAILEPRSLGLFAFIVVLMLAAYWFDVLLRKRLKFYRNFVENRLKSKYSDPLVMIIVVLLFTVVFMQDLAVKNADAIKSKGKDSYQVRFYENQSGESVKNLELLGSTSRFAYFYDLKNKQSVVISPENLSYMSKPLTQDISPENEVLVPQEIKKSTNHKGSDTFN